MSRDYGHCVVVGQPVPLVNGQHAHTHLVLVPDTMVTFAVLVPLLIVPMSPDPVSPSVPCQVPFGSSSNPVSGVAETDVTPAGAQITCWAAEDAPPLPTATLHHER